MHKRGARGATANRNAVIMDAQPATVVQQREGTTRTKICRSKGTRQTKKGNGISSRRSLFVRVSHVRTVV